jgi:arsenite methyltransferase
LSPLSFLDFHADFTASHIVRAYDEQPLWSAMFGLLMLEHLPLRAKTALDIGCGTGFPLIELAERLGPNCRVEGIDTWNEALDRAREKIAAGGLSNVFVHRCSASTMPFANEAFDMIVSNLGLNNFDDRTGALKECRRVAKAGGVLAITTNLRGHMQEFYSAFERVLRAVSDEDGLARLRDHIDHRATIPGVESLLQANGFRVTRFVERSSRLRFASGTALFNHHFVKLGFLDGWRQVAVTNQRSTFQSLREELDRQSDEVGELSFTIPMAYIEAVAV